MPQIMDIADEQVSNAPGMLNGVDLRALSGTKLPEGSQLSALTAKRSLHTRVSRQRSFILSGAELKAFLVDGDWKTAKDNTDLCKEIVQPETGLYITKLDRQRKRSRKMMNARCYFYTQNRGHCPVRIQVEVTLNSSGSSAVVNVRPHKGPHNHKTSCSLPRPSQQSILDKLASTAYEKLRAANNTRATSAAANSVSREYDGLEVSRPQLKSALLKKKRDALMKLFDIEGGDTLTQMA